jgi:hypothetical protein
MGEELALQIASGQEVGEPSGGDLATDRMRW